MTDTGDRVLEGTGLVKEFTQGGVTLEVLRGASIAVAAGERIAIVGASGSGKTTLLQLLGGLDLPTRGSVHIAGGAMNQLMTHNAACCAIRRSVSCTSSIICCPNSPRWKTWRCRCWSGA